MALLTCNFYSESLGLSTSMNVILPQQTQSQIGLDNVKRPGPHKTLYLLHGLSDDDTIWVRRTSIERYAAAYGIAIVMPQVHRSFYTDMAYGEKYWAFISEELPKLARSFFPLSDKREDNFAAGLSMGGYGAFKLALRRPDLFSAGASLSGALDIASMVESPNNPRSGLLHTVFGDQKVRGSEDDLLFLLDRVAKSNAPAPKLYQCCGTEDFLYADNQTFKKAADRSGLDFTYEEGPGEHEWGYWDRMIQQVLKWLPLDEPKK